MKYSFSYYSPLCLSFTRINLLYIKTTTGGNLIFLLTFHPFLFDSHDNFAVHHRIKGFLSIDIDVSELQVNQCYQPQVEEYYAARNSKANHYTEILHQVEAFHGSHKCHSDSMKVGDTKSASKKLNINKKKIC